MHVEEDCRGSCLPAAHELIRATACRFVQQGRLQDRDSSQDLFASQDHDQRIGYDPIRF
jgi:hypothetical protein